MAHFEINKSTDKQFYFTLVANNGEIIATSEMYTSKQSCRDSIIAMVYIVTYEFEDDIKIEDKTKR